MIRATALTALLISTASLSAGQDADAAATSPKPQIKSLQKHELYVEPHSKATFPPQAGAFNKTEVVQSPNPFYGTVVRYAAKDGSCADVYIYSIGMDGRNLDDSTAETHFKGVKQAIERLPETGMVVESVKLKDESQIYVGAKPILARRALFAIEAGDRNFESELLIFPFKDRIVKLRISHPIPSPQNLANDGTLAKGFIAEMGKVFSETPAAASPPAPEPRPPQGSP